MIKFLQRHVTESVPPETFDAGQVVKDRPEASELHFVRRGVAAFFDPRTKELTDHEGKPVEPTVALPIVVTAADRRAGLPGRSGEVMLDDGTNQRGTSGPGQVLTTSAVTGGEPATAVVEGDAAAALLNGGDAGQNR